MAKSVHAAQINIATWLALCVCKCVVPRKMWKENSIKYLNEFTYSNLSKSIITIIRMEKAAVFSHKTQSEKQRKNKTEKKKM